MYTSTVLSLVLAATLSVAVPVPLEVEYLQRKPNDGDHVAKMEESRQEANRQIEAMRTTVDRARAGSPGAKDRVRQAFGPNADLEQIDLRVDQLQNGKFTVANSDPQHADAIRSQRAGTSVQGNISVPSVKDKDGKFQSMGPANVGSKFYSLSKEQRAGTLIHEATHQQSWTGDDVVYTPGHPTRIRATYDVPPDHKIEDPRNPNVHVRSRHTVISMKAGYAGGHDPNTMFRPIRSESDLDPGYKTVRDSARNMHDNADSYRAFAGICSSASVKRALMEDDPVAYLAKRGSSCALPADYFAKKAAAAKAAKSGTAKGKTGAVKGGDSPASRKTTTSAKSKSRAKSGANTVANIKNTVGKTKSTTRATSKASLGKRPGAGKAVGRTKTSTHGIQKTKGGMAAKKPQADRKATPRAKPVKPKAPAIGKTSKAVGNIHLAKDSASKKASLGKAGATPKQPPFANKKQPVAGKKTPAASLQKQASASAVESVAKTPKLGKAQIAAPPARKAAPVAKVVPKPSPKKNHRRDLKLDELD